MVSKTVPHCPLRKMWRQKKIEGNYIQSWEFMIKLLPHWGHGRSTLWLSSSTGEKGLFRLYFFPLLMTYHTLHAELTKNIFFFFFLKERTKNINSLKVEKVCKINQISDKSRQISLAKNKTNCIYFMWNENMDNSAILISLWKWTLCFTQSGQETKRPNQQACWWAE